MSHLKEDIHDEDDGDYAFPEKTLLLCPLCDGVPGKNKTCTLCKGKGFLPVSNEHAQWIEEE
jgi:hypothetical protein